MKDRIERIQESIEMLERTWEDYNTLNSKEIAGTIDEVTKQLKQAREGQTKALYLTTRELDRIRQGKDLQINVENDILVVTHKDKKPRYRHKGIRNKQ